MNAIRQENHLKECTIIALHCASAFGVTLNDMLSRRRSALGLNMSDVRQMYYYIARTHTAASFPTIGNAIQKDHTTVMHGYQQARFRFADRAWVAKLQLVMNALGFSHPSSL